MPSAKDLQEEAKIIKLPGALLLFILGRMTKELPENMAREVLDINILAKTLTNLGYSRYVEQDQLDEDLASFKNVGFVDIFRCPNLKGKNKDAIIILITEKGRKLVKEMRLYDHKTDSEKKHLGRTEGYIIEEQLQKAINDARGIL